MNLVSPCIRRIILSSAIMICSALTASAADQTKKDFDIPAGDAEKSLRLFSAQSGVQIIFPTEIAKGARTRPIKGRFIPRDAIDLMLDRSGLVAVRDEATGSLTVRRGPDDPNAQRVALEKSSDRPSADSQSESQDEKALMMGVYEVKDKKPFTDSNVDIVRTMDDPQPYYIFKSDVIEQSGAINVEDFLKQRLSMDSEIRTNSQLAATTLGATSAISLRGLGSNQTLILINGRRMASINNAGSALQPDLNNIPLAAIDRVEILPASAAAIYGGSAVGGVINVVLKRAYSGAEIKTTYGNTVDGKAPTWTLDGVVGMSLENGKTHAMLSAHYSTGNPLLFRDRTFLESYVGRILQNSPNFFNSNTNPFLGATTNISSVSGSNLTLLNGTSLNSPITYVPSGTSLSTSASALNAGLLANAGHFNLSPPASLQGSGPDGLLVPLYQVPTVKSMLANLRREMTSNLELFAEFENSSTITVDPYNPILTAVQVPGGAPGNPFQQTVAVKIPNNVNAPIRNDNITRRITAGFTLKLPFDWKAEGDYTWSWNSLSYISPFRDTTKLAADVTNGTLNPFVDTLANPPNMTPYFGVTSSTGNSSLNDVGLRMAGPLWHLPAGVPTLAFAFEHRKEGNINTPLAQSFPYDPVFNGNFITLGISDTVDSGYAEAEIPLISSVNKLPGIQQLDLQFAARSEKYSARVPVNIGSFNLAKPPASIASNNSNYTSTNPTIGLRYKPVEGVTLRASYGTGFLPPNYAQLEPSLTLFPFTVIDPVLKQTYTTLSRGGGNPDLKPEKSKNWNMGAIFEPDCLKGFRISLDWYQIEKTNQISTLPTQSIVNFVAAGLLPSSLVQRDSVTGQITSVFGGALNLTRLVTEGFDFTTEYRSAKTPFGTFDLFAMGTDIEHFKQQAVFGVPLQDYVNWVRDNGPAKYKGNATLTWEYSRWTMGWTTLYFGGYNQQGAAGDPVTTDPTVLLASGSQKIPGIVTHNFSIGYSFADGGKRYAKWCDAALSNVRIKCGVTNVFNSTPPFDPGYAPYYYDQFGDVHLRSYWISVAKAF